MTSPLRIPATSIAEASAALIRSDHAPAHGSAVVVYDLDALAARLRHVRDVWPEAVHCYAVKAAPLPPLLDFCVEQGFGLEAASLPELALSLTTDCEAGAILFDSPLKSDEELRIGAASGVVLNLNDLTEVERLAAMIGDENAPGRSIGLRVNPQVGAGSIAATSVARKVSKFGEPLENREAIVTVFKTHRWLTGLHIHVGSQGMSVEQLLAGAEAAVALVSEIESATGRQLRYLDLGGGLPAAYDDHVADCLPEYVAGLRERCPILFDADVERVTYTEFGRYLVVNSAWLLAPGGSVRAVGGERLIGLPVGADFALRECYQPGQWPHEFLALDSRGELLTGDHSSATLVGPLCFSGDTLQRDVPLPELTAGDWIAMRDVGGYTFAMWSRYNSRPFPPIVGFTRSENAEYRWQTLHPGEAVDDVLRFWNGD